MERILEKLSKIKDEFKKSYDNVTKIAEQKLTEIDKESQKDLKDIKEKTIQTVEDQLENFAKKLEEFNNKISKK